MSLRKLFERQYNMKARRGIFGGRKKKGERRRSPRVRVSCLQAVYWDGSTDNTHTILEIGSYGAVISTSTDWFPGTLIRITIRHRDHDLDQEDKLPSIWSRVVRAEDGRICIEFLYFGKVEFEGLNRYLERCGVKIYGDVAPKSKAVWQRTGAH